MFSNTQLTGSFASLRLHECVTDTRQRREQHARTHRCGRFGFAPRSSSSDCKHLEPSGAGRWWRNPDELLLPGNKDASVRQTRARGCSFSQQFVRKCEENGAQKPFLPKTTIVWRWACWHPVPKIAAAWWEVVFCHDVFCKVTRKAIKLPRAAPRILPLIPSLIDHSLEGCRWKENC